MSGLLAGLRRAAVLIAVAVVAFLAAVPAIDDLDALLKWVGGICLVLALVIVYATVRRHDSQGSKTA